MRLISIVYSYRVNSNPMSRYHHIPQNICTPSNEDVPAVAPATVIHPIGIHVRGRIHGHHTEVVPVHVTHIHLAARLLTSASPILLRRHEAIPDSDIPISQLRLVLRIVAISVALPTISSLIARNGPELREAQLVSHPVLRPERNVHELLALVLPGSRRETRGEGELGHSSSRIFGPL